MRVTQAIAIVLILALSVGVQPRAGAQAQNRAGLVVQFAGGQTRSYCLAFTGESISGLDLLRKSGLPVITEQYGSMGGMVCKIGGEGCNYPGEACACKSYGPGGIYWNYHHLREGVWKTSSVGAAAYRVKPGEVDGWAWSAGKPPPVMTLEQICSPAKATATRTVSPQPVVTPTPRRTPTTLPGRRPGRAWQPTPKDGSAFGILHSAFRGVGRGE
mgnify:CR=1 FL=1